METMPVVLQNKEIRRKRHNGEWWFAVEDLCGMLMDDSDGGACWRKLKRSLAKEGCDVGALCHALELHAVDGTGRQADCVTLEGVFRIVQSVYTPKVEVIKRWLAQVGTEQNEQRGCRTDLASVFAMLEDAATVAIVSRQDGQDGGREAATRKAARIVGEARVKLTGETREKSRAIQIKENRR